MDWPVGQQWAGEPVFKAKIDATHADNDSPESTNLLENVVLFKQPYKNL